MGNPLCTQQPDMNELFRQFQQDPLRYLTDMNLPQGMTDYRQIVQYLADNGKIPPMLQAKVKAMLGR